MKLVLVRTARAVKRSDWTGPGGGRPLSDAGDKQAKGLVDLLGGTHVRAVACGPSLRSRQTLTPLANALGLPLQIDDRLDRDAPPAELMARVSALGEEGAVVCLHRGGLLAALEKTMGAGQADLESRCERGGAWIVEGDPAQATYFSPGRSGFPADDAIEPLASVPLTGRKGRRPGAPRIAVLDLGSTSFHLLVAEWTADGTMQRIDRERVMLRMGAELARSGHIRKALLERSIEAVHELCDAAREWKAEQLVAVGTSALRDAKNGSTVVAALEEAIGGPIHLLSGEEEARIIFRAIRSRIDLGGRTHIGLDLGGGSLEVVVGNDHEILYEKTLPLGVARLHGLIDPADPHREKDLRKLRHILREALTPVAEEIRRFDAVGCVAVGGTARSVARVIARGKNNVGGSSLRGLRISRRELDTLSRDLGACTMEERLRRPGVSPRRADLLPFGSEILNTALTLFGARGLTLCDWGLREGILLELRPAGD